MQLDFTISELCRYAVVTVLIENKGELVSLKHTCPILAFHTLQESEPLDIVACMTSPTHLGQLTFPVQVA